jgi:ubiquitin
VGRTAYESVLDEKTAEKSKEEAEVTSSEGRLEALERVGSSAAGGEQVATLETSDLLQLVEKNLKSENYAGEITTSHRSPALYLCRAEKGQRESGRKLIASELTTPSPTPCPNPSDPTSPRIPSHLSIPGSRSPGSNLEWERSESALVDRRSCEITHKSCQRRDCRQRKEHWPSKR